MVTKRDKFQGRVNDGVDRPCDWPDCEKAGAFRAPLPRDLADDLSGELSSEGDGGKLRLLRESALDDRVDESAWFCLLHVREYNAEWDFFDGMNEDEINDFRDDDASWHRPTWPASGPTAGAGPGAGPWTDTEAFADPHGLFSHATPASSAAAGFNRPLAMADLEALRVLGLAEDASVADIKSSFKRLAKKHHPDLNNGDRDSEDRLRQVIEAYNCLSEAFRDC